MDVQPVLRELLKQKCQFVVVGSAARYLLGEAVTPNDLDIVAASDRSNRPLLISALSAVGASIRRREAWRDLAPGVHLPWEWGFTVRTLHGRVDVITQFIDGTTFADHNEQAVTVRLTSCQDLRCNPTTRAKNR